MSNRARILLGLGVGLPILVIVLTTTGDLLIPVDDGLPTAPVSTLIALPIDIWIRDLATAVTLGMVVIGGVLAPKPYPRLVALASGAALVWLASLAAQEVLVLSEVLAVPIGDALDPTLIWSLVTQTQLGVEILVQAGLVLLVALLGWAIFNRATGIVVLAIAMLAAWLPGLVGHGGLAGSHGSATLSLGLHMVFAGLWVGGLIAMASYAGVGGASSANVLRRFSLLALICVVMISETGLINAALRLDGFASLLTTTYGTIILAKIALLTVLVAWGWRHRRSIANEWDLHPDETVLDAGFRVVFLRWVGWEVLWMGAVYGLSVALSRTPPPTRASVDNPVDLGAVAVLLLCIPCAIAFLLPDSRMKPSWATRAPAAVVVVGLVVATAISVVMPRAREGLLIQATIFVACAVLLFIGWTIVVALSATRHRKLTAAVALVGWPVTAWWITRSDEFSLSASTLLVVLLGEGVISWLVFAPKPSRPSRSALMADMASVQGTSS